MREKPKIQTDLKEIHTQPNIDNMTRDETLAMGEEEARHYITSVLQDPRMTMKTIDEKEMRVMKQHSRNVLELSKKHGLGEWCLQFIPETLLAPDSAIASLYSSLRDIDSYPQDEILKMGREMAQCYITSVMKDPKITKKTIDVKEIGVIKRYSRNVLGLIKKYDLVKWCLQRIIPEELVPGSEKASLYSSLRKLQEAKTPPLEPPLEIEEGSIQSVGGSSDYSRRDYRKIGPTPRYDEDDSGTGRHPADE